MLLINLSYCQNQTPNSSAKVGSVTHGSSVKVNVSGRSLASRAITPVIQTLLWRNWFYCYIAHLESVIQLNLHIDSMNNLKYLREEILEQLGKNANSFNLKFDVAARKICFVETDDIKVELHRILMHKAIK